MRADASDDEQEHAGRAARLDRPAGSPDRDVSPDELDRLLRLVRPRTWTVLAGLLVLVAIVIVWSVVGTVTTTVGASGLITRGDGLAPVQAPVAGTARLNVALGDTVTDGDTIATIVTSDGDSVPVTAPFDGTVVEVDTAREAVVDFGASLMSIGPTEGELAAVVYLPIDDRSEVEVGAAVRVRVDEVVDSQLGHIVGSVRSISPFPADADEIALSLGSSQLALDLSERGSVYRVDVGFERSATTSSGVAWSSGAGDDVDVEAGQIVDARIIVSEESLVELIFP